MILPWRLSAAVLGASTSEMSDCVDEISATVSCPLCAKVTATLSTLLQNINVRVSRGTYLSLCVFQHYNLLCCLGCQEFSMIERCVVWGFVNFAMFTNLDVRCPLCWSEEASCDWFCIN